MLRRGQLVVIAVAVVSLGAPLRAGAQRAGKPAKPRAPNASAVAPADAAARERARQLLREGNQQLDRGLYLDALKSFQQAYEMFRSPNLLFNLAQTYNELGRLLEALHHYEQYVQSVTREDNQQLWSLANERIYKLQGRIATVQVQCNVVDATVTADGSPVGKTPLSAALRFMPGAHAIVLTKPGFEQQVIEVTLRAGDAVVRRVGLLTEDEAAATKRAVQAAEARRLVAFERERQTKEKLQRTRRILRVSGWAAVGTGAAVAITGAIFGGLSLRESSTVEDAPRGTLWPTVKGSFQNADTYRKVCYYGTGIGAGVAVAGAVLVGWSYRGAVGERRPATLERLSATPFAGPQQVGLAVAGRF
jgi:hypothetical protein